jgi:hydroxymethylpyrimidine pyrophosphatase-like HAD family hydrolase
MPDFSHERFLEITGEGVDKGWAVQRYCQAHGLAIGDGPNDLPLFAFAGTSVAPANAHPDVRATATAVTADNDHDGVAKALECFIS